MAARHRGRLDLAFSRSGDRTVLSQRIFTYPFTMTRAYYRDAAPKGMASVVLQSVSSSLSPGDRLRQRLVAHAGAAAYITTQGATVVHGSAERRECAERLEIVAEEGSLLEYMSDLRILFPGAILSQEARIRLGLGATVVFCEGIASHDPSGGQRPFGNFRTVTLIEDEDGHILAMDCGRLPGTSRAVAGGGRFAAYGTLFVATRRPPAELKRLADAIAADVGAVDVYGAASLLPNDCGVSVRFAASDGRGLRRGIVAGWQATRRHLFGGSPGLLGQALWQPMAG
ncbi:urease accessory protein [Mesorhizobium australicum]|jgi:urease accessory protein|uniref:Urease accessory protein UreD n=1 Tax=Mesorhizobium australicum TaxID=536018 RepID=A0A1X7MQC4_9HYPH|nr:urease accessory protein [Mesorhizobium australicum]